MGASWRVNSIAFSPDGKFIAGGTDNRSIKIWRVKNGKEIQTYKSGESVYVHSVDYSPDGRFIAAGMEDGSICVWNLKNSKSISLLSSDNDKWYVYSEDGLFDCSEKGKERVKIVRGMNVLDSKEDWNKLYTPGLMSQFMGKPSGKKKTKSKGFLIGRVWNINSLTRLVKIAVKKSSTLSPGNRLKVYAGKKLIYLTIKNIFHTNVSCSISGKDVKRLETYALVYK